MSSRNYSSEKLKKTNKKQYYNQMFYIHHPLLQQIISAKLQKCLKYGQVRDIIKGKGLEKQSKVQVIEAPCVVGNSKTIQIRFKTSRKSMGSYQSRLESRPKTTNTVIRSRTSQPKIRQKLEYLMKEDDNFQENLRPTFYSRRHVQSSRQSLI